jgi:hypothetical protein
VRLRREISRGGTESYYKSIDGEISAFATLTAIKSPAHPNEGSASSNHKNSSNDALTIFVILQGKENAGAFRPTPMADKYP